MSEKRWDNEEIESLLREREDRILKEKIREAMENVPETRREEIENFLEARAGLGRFEHGGHFVSVHLDGQWVPLERAVERLAQTACDEG